MLSADAASCLEWISEKIGACKMIDMCHSFNENFIHKLLEKTEYEAWLLEEIYKIAEQNLFPDWPDSVVYSLDNPTPQFTTYGRANIVIGDWRPKFLDAGAPLIFVSAFKLLDMFMEWIIEGNGLTPNYRFSSKIKQLESGVIFPRIIEDQPWLKMRLIGLYKTLEPLRGTIIHNKQFNVADGHIVFTNTRTEIASSTTKISPDQLRKLALVLISIVRYVDGSWRLDHLKERHLRYDLDVLSNLHNLESLDQPLPYHTRVRAYRHRTLQQPIDTRMIMKDLASNYRDVDISFDLRIMLVDDGQIIDAYLLPWEIVSNLRKQIDNIEDYHDFRDVIPIDSKPEHFV